jgi:hypothetical protein
MTTEQKLKAIFVDYNKMMERGIYPADLDNALEVIKDLNPKMYWNVYGWAIKNPALTMIE